MDALDAGDTVLGYIFERTFNHCSWCVVRVDQDSEVFLIVGAEAGVADTFAKGIESSISLIYIDF